MTSKDPNQRHRMSRKARARARNNLLQQREAEARQLQRSRNRALNEAQRVYAAARKARNLLHEKWEKSFREIRATGHATLEEEQRSLREALDQAQSVLEVAWTDLRKANIAAEGHPGKYPHPKSLFQKRKEFQMYMTEIQKRKDAEAHRVGASPREKSEVIDLIQDDPHGRIQSRPEMVQPNVQPNGSWTHRLKQEPLAFDAAALQTIERVGPNSRPFRDLPRGLTPLIKREEQTPKTSVIRGLISFNQAELYNNQEAQKPLITFGLPSVPLPVLQRTAWTNAKPKTAVNSISGEDRSLEDLYRDYPEKRLRGIEPETFGLVADTVHQVAREAADNWLQSACPGTRWNDSIVNVEGLCKYNGPNGNGKSRVNMNILTR